MSKNCEPSYARVIIRLASKPSLLFDYQIPEGLRTKIAVGSNVVVPLGDGYRAGYVLELTDKPFHLNPKPITLVLPESNLTDSSTLNFCNWLSWYYLANQAACFDLFLPPGGQRHLEKRYVLINRQAVKKLVASKSKQEELEKLFASSDFVTAKQMRASLGASLVRRLLDNNCITAVNTLTPPRIQKKTTKIFYLKDKDNLDLKGLGEKQRAILKILASQSLEKKKLLELASASSKSLISLVKKGVVSSRTVDVFRQTEFSFPSNYQRPKNLSLEQLGVISTIKKSIANQDSQPYLLQGVTASGKTEVYAEIIKEAMSQGGSSLVLVPEILQTAQMVRRLESYLGCQVSQFHSQLTLGQRFDVWRKAKLGELTVVVGARSALFLPLQNLKLIVVDEEHDSSYKEDRAPRYHARTAALKLGEIKEAVVVLGSATPSLESRFMADKNCIKRLVLSRRVKGKLPPIKIVDMRQEFRKKNWSIFSQVLREEMIKTVEAEQRMILLINRRGYSHFLLCRDCGYVPRCRNCSVSLTFHLSNHRLLCHHCGYSDFVPDQCPNCNGVHLRKFGVGTQRLEVELKKVFPSLPIIRIDKDTTSKRGAYLDHLLKFSEQSPAALVGTQMVAKGLDFENISLVGVINADSALYQPDFRSGEKTYQLLIQVSGRSGRGIPGKVIIQTYLPEHYAIQAVLQGDYESFYQKEINQRKELGYPPVRQMISITISGKNKSKVEAESLRISQYFSKILNKREHQILGPAPALIYKKLGYYREQINILTGKAEICKQILWHNWQKTSSISGVKITANVDPIFFN